MKKKHIVTRRRILLFIAALCLCAGAAAQGQKERVVEFKPTRAQKAEAERMRAALAAALGEGFEVSHHRLARRSRRGGAVYWLAHLLARRPGEFQLKYKYRYKDRVNPRDPLYTFVEHRTHVRVGPRGCDRRPRSNFVCVGDTFILPVLAGDHAGHTFSVESQPFSPGDPAREKALRRMDEAGLYREPVRNPAAPFLKYLGSRAHVAYHRAPGYTVRYAATFEAVGPGAFNLALRPNILGAATSYAAAAGSVPVIVLDPKAPATVLSVKDDVHGYGERFSSTGGGTSFLTTPVILQPGELLTLHYYSHSYRGRLVESETREALEANVKKLLPLINLLPFRVDPAQDFNEWIAEFLPPGGRG